MIDDRVTLELKGTVPLNLFATAISALSGLIGALTREVARNSNVEWVVEDLSGGSATAIIVGQSDDLESVERVVNAYAEVGRALYEKCDIPFSDPVRKEVRQMTSILDGRVSTVVLRTRKKEYEVTAEVAPLQERVEPGLTSYGAIEGMVQTLTNRNEIKFTLYDALYDRAVSCHLGAGQENLMRDIWGKRALVQGWVTRDPVTGRPTDIRDIANVVPVISGDYRRALGVLKPVDDELPEASIRRLRDAQ